MTDFNVQGRGCEASAHLVEGHVLDGAKLNVGEQGFQFCNFPLPLGAVVGGQIRLNFYVTKARHRAWIVREEESFLIQLASYEGLAVVGLRADVNVTSRDPSGVLDRDGFNNR